MADTKTGKEIARRWGLDVEQALYRKTGDWYHQLKKFPGALLDADGYVVFDSAEAFKSCKQLRLGKDPDRHGGWVAATNGIKEIPGYVRVVPTADGADRSFIEFVVRPRARAQGQAWGGSPEGRKAIESYAMDLAIRHYTKLWPEVRDVSATEPFDLSCREGDRELRVEVKGTTSLGLSILLTRNEVRHARENKERVALFIVSNIVTVPGGCAGGTIHIVQPWDIREADLEPIAFEYRLRERGHANLPANVNT